MEPKMIRKRKRQVVVEDDDVEPGENHVPPPRDEDDDGGTDERSMYHRTLTNFRKVCKLTRYNIMDGEMYIIDYFPHPSERDSIGRPISNDVTSFKLRKYRIVPETERGNYLTCMWSNPTKGSSRIKQLTLSVFRWKRLLPLDRDTDGGWDLAEIHWRVVEKSRVVKYFVRLECGSV